MEGDMMGRIADTVAEGLPDPPTRPNKLDRILAGLDDDDRGIVLDWLHDLDLGEEHVEDRLRACGITVSDSTVRRWRRHNVRATWAA